MMEYIASTGTPAGSSLTFTSIPNTFNSLYMTGILHITGSSIGGGYFRFNSDSGSNYSYIGAGPYNGNTSTGSVTYGAGGEGYFASIPMASYNVGACVTNVEIELWGYRKAATDPGVAGWLCNNSFTNSSSQNEYRFWTGWYSDQTSDITQIDLITSQGSWSTHSKVHLYGRTDS